MDSPDQDFLKEYGPLHVPYKYDKADTMQNKIVYALADLEYATAAQVGVKLNELEPEISAEQHQHDAQVVLEDLFNRGRIRGNDSTDNRQYNLGKIEIPNSGKADALF